ncbi:MAG: chloride channel protein, partial [Syntrophomonadaceae bacterium]|nr:chloride channel protein [Syntrophomonadaceae bacterium]
SGGSVGREGPIVQIGSAIGSTVGQLLKFSESNLKTLVACGAAGGISATFNAPIGGVLFAQEIILGQFSTNNFVLIVISSVVSAVIGRIYFGDVPAFRVPAYELLGPHELGFYILLGVLAGLFALLYIRTLYWFEDLFDRLNRIPEYHKPILGGLLVGLIGIRFPEVFGVGYETVEKALANQLLMVTLVSLLFLKLLATSLTIGSGGSGGVFAPGLFMGAMLGGTFGILLGQLWPGVSSPPGAYSLVGMGAVFASMAHAPITAMIMLFEMSNDYRIILPLMIACVIGTLVSSQLYRENIYTLKLLRRGLDLKTSRIPDRLEALLVNQAMTREVIAIPKDCSINEAQRLVRDTGHLGYPITNPDGTLCGIVTWQDIIRAIRAAQGQEPVYKICTTPVVRTWPLESLKVVAEKMAANRIGRLPVVESENSEKLVGIITRSDIINQYRIHATNNHRAGGSNAGFRIDSSNPGR